MFIRLNDRDSARRHERATTMSKQYMTIQFGDRTATVRTNSEKAIKNALGKLRNNVGHVVSIEVSGNEIKFQIAYRKASKGEFQATYDRYATIIENTFVTEETAEVVEAPAVEVVAEETAVTMTLEEKRAAWDIFVKEWAKSRADEIKAIRAAEAKEATMDAEERLAYNQGRTEVKVYAETMTVADIEAHIVAYTTMFTDHLATVFADGMRSELATITK